MKAVKEAAHAVPPLLSSSHQRSGCSLVMVTRVSGWGTPGPGEQGFYAKMGGLKSQPQSSPPTWLPEHWQPELTL